MKTKKLVLALLTTSAAACFSAPAMAQAEPFIGQMMLFAGNFCPRGWQPANGQLVSIAQNTALFSILGTTYGGNGQTTFALPDLRGRVPVSVGQGPGLSDYTLGEVAGTETTTLLTTQMPIHTHQATATTLIKIAAGQVADTNKPAGNTFANTGPLNVYYTGAPTANYMDNDTAATAVTVGVQGGSQPFSIMQPYLAMQWCVAVEGIFPSRN